MFYLGDLLKGNEEFLQEYGEELAQVVFVVVQNWEENVEIARLDGGYWPGCSSPFCWLEALPEGTEKDKKPEPSALRKALKKHLSRIVKGYLHGTTEDFKATEGRKLTIQSYDCKFSEGEIVLPRYITLEMYDEYDGLARFSIQSALVWEGKAFQVVSTVECGIETDYYGECVIGGYSLEHSTEYIF